MTTMTSSADNLLEVRDLSVAFRQGERELLASYLKMGEAQLNSGRHGEALGTYKKALALSQRLQAPGILIGGIHDSIGDILMAQGDLGGALASHQAALVVAEQLAASLLEANRECVSVGKSFHELVAAKCTIDEISCVEPEPGAPTL